MKKLLFTKMVASGNDFVVVETSSQSLPCRQAGIVRSPQILSKKICDRKYGAGADGVLLLGKSKIADMRMRIFNADGSEAEMCGNGARCAALWAKSKILKIETKAGVIDAEVSGDNVKIKLTDPKDIKLDIPVKINNRNIRVNFIDTGVPHAVIFTEGLEKIDILPLGKQIRYHKEFSPRGTNVDFVEVDSRDSIKVRTYERGVEDETLACGTGSAASAIIFALKARINTNKNLIGTNKISVHTQSKEILNVYFTGIKDKINNVWLEGKARKVYEGAYYV